MKKDVSLRKLTEHSAVPWCPLLGRIVAHAYLMRPGGINLYYSFEKERPRISVRQHGRRFDVLFTPEDEPVDTRESATIAKIDGWAMTYWNAMRWRAVEYKGKPLPDRIETDTDGAMGYLGLVGRNSIKDLKS